MPPPVAKYATNKKTGQNAVSFDDGATWFEVPEQQAREQTGATVSAAEDETFREQAEPTAATPTAADLAETPEPITPPGVRQPESKAGIYTTPVAGGVPSFVGYKPPQTVPVAAQAPGPQIPAPTASWLGGGDMAALPHPEGPQAEHSDNEPFMAGMADPFGGGAQAAGVGAAVNRAVTGDEQPRMAGRGIAAPVDERSAYQVGRDNESDLLKRAQSRDPRAYGAGQMTSEMLSQLPAMAVGGAPATLRGAMTTGAVGASIPAAARGGFSSKADSAMGVAKDALTEGAIGGAVGAATGGALHMAASGIPMAATGAGLGALGGGIEGYQDPDKTVLGSALLRGAEGAVALPLLAGAAAPLARRMPGAMRALEEKASIMRAAAPGGYGSTLNLLAAEKGPAGVAQLGREIERMGLHKRTGLERLLPGKTPGGYYRAAAPVEKQTGQEIGRHLSDASTIQGVQIPRSAIVRPMLREAKRLGKSTSDDDLAKARVIQRLADRTVAKNPSSMTPEQVHALKKQWERQAYNDIGANKGARALAYKAAANAPRKALYAGMRQQAEQTETLPGFLQNMRDHGTAAKVASMSGKRSAMEAGNQTLSLPTTQAAGNASPGVGALMAAGIAGTKAFGKDAGANALRNFERVVASNPEIPASLPIAAGAFASRASNGPPAPPKPIQTGPMPVTPPSAEPTGDPAQREYMQPNGAGAESPGDEVDQLKKSLGHQTDRRIQTILESSTPEQMPFGDYTEELYDAYDSGDEKQIAAAIAKVDSDPEFRRVYGHLMFGSL